MLASAPSVWRQTIEDKYAKKVDGIVCNQDAKCVAKVLKEDFFPGYKYAAVKVGTGGCVTFGQANSKNFGGTCIGDVYMMFINPAAGANNLPQSGGLPPSTWVNTVCSGPMCNNEKKTCYFGICGQPFCSNGDNCSQGKENVRINNRASFNKYSERDALIVNTGHEMPRCVVWQPGYLCCSFEAEGDKCVGGYTCGGSCKTTKWANVGDASSISRVYGDKNIVEQFNVWETNDGNKDRWQFTIMGVSAGS